MTNRRSPISKLSEIFDKIVRFRKRLSVRKQNALFVSPGHFYSPIPSIAEIKNNEEKIFGNIPRNIEGVDLHQEEQLKLLTQLLDYYKQLPDYKPEPQIGLRYYYQNSEYKYCDAILLFCMIMHLKPKRIIEVGSGYSSCLILDTNEIFFNNSIITEFIDPYPQRFLSHIKESDRSRIELRPSPLQDVEIDMFESLQANDILFIDSTHVCMTYSDVNRIFFEILPRLSSGVYIHFHDIFYPFEYPKKWVYEGRAWNEAYLLRAFLQYNQTFQIALMNTYMEYYFDTFFRENMPLCLNAKGGSIWIRKV
jgi:hypothetical protein